VSEVEKRLGELADAINAEHRAFVETFRKSVEHAIHAGGLLSEAKAQCAHGEWLGWLEDNFEGAPRTAQEYMRLYHHRDEIRAKTRDSAHLSVSGALKELAAPVRPEGLPPDEWEIVRRAHEVVWFLDPDMERLTERLAACEENTRRGFVAQMAWSAMLFQGQEYALMLHTIEEEGLHSVTPKLLTTLQAEAEKLRWWVERSEWIEGLVRACDWPPGGGMPTAAFDEHRKHLPLCKLYDDENENGIPSPRGRIREFCGPVV
jgi:hypothetical protein